MATTAKKKAAKKPHKKQHDVRGATLIRLAARFRQVAALEDINFLTTQGLVGRLAGALEAEGKLTRRMR